MSKPKNPGPIWPSSKFDQAGFPPRHVRKLTAVMRGDEDGAEGDLHTTKSLLRWPAPEAAKMERALERLKHPDGGVVVVVGPRGTGKTQMATDLALVYHRDQVLDESMPEHYRDTMSYRPLADLYEAEKAAWNRREGGNAGPLQAAGACGFLVLDEIQDVMNSEWERVQLTRLFDRRYAAVKRTILITNMKTDGLCKHLGESMWSRIREIGLLVELAGRNYRNTKGQKS